MVSGMKGYGLISVHFSNSSHTALLPSFALLFSHWPPLSLGHSNLTAASGILNIPYLLLKATSSGLSILLLLIACLGFTLNFTCCKNLLTSLVKVASKYLPHRESSSILSIALFYQVVSFTSSMCSEFNQNSIWNCIIYFVFQLPSHSTNRWK